MKVKASVNYHVESQKPQAFLFDVDGIDGNLVSPELLTTDVDVTDLRNHRGSVGFDTDGISFETHKSQITSFEQSENWRPTYDREISALLQRKIGAKEVLVFDHTVRIDDADASRKPARNVHNDYSSQGAHQRLVDLIGNQKAAEYQQGQFAFVNVWRPIEQTIVTSPLGFIRPSSMSLNDWLNIELIYPDRKGQILGVTANPKHDWFYQSNMTPNEVIIFNIYDNQGRPHLAHSALDIANQSKADVPRKSIETRTLVRY